MGGCASPLGPVLPLPTLDSVSPPKVPADQPSSVAPWLFGAAILLPLLFVGWHAASFLCNAPFWDEFGTVLGFLTKYQQTDSWSGLLSLLTAQDNEHRILTSRLIFITIYQLTGGVNFIHLAILGNLFGMGAIAVIAWQQPDRPLRWLLAAMLSLLVFQMQHYENLFLSYASIDHFHVVLLCAGSLALLARGRRWTDAGALLVAGLAVFTLTHGLAVFPAGALLLVCQRRWRSLTLWGAGTLAIGAFFLWEFANLDRPLPALAGLAGWRTLGHFWLTLLGGVPALGSAVLGPVFGALALAAVAWLWHRGAFVRDPFLGALIACVLIAALVISYGRFGVEGVPPLSSRYMVQSAVLWAALGLLGLKTIGDPRFVVRRGLVLVPLLAGLSGAADLRFFREARFFVHKRIEATRYYDKHGTFKGAPYPVFPNPQLADQLLVMAQKSGIFQLQLRSTPQVHIAAETEECTLASNFDEITVGLTHVHLRGWLLPPSAQEAAFEPHLILRTGTREFVFRGIRENRPDVARSFQRPYAAGCGFYFVVPRNLLPKSKLQISLALVGRWRALVSATDREFVNQRTAVAAIGPASTETTTDD